jgi:hypothetical protein
MNIIRNALWRALIYVAIVLFISLLPLVLTTITDGTDIIHFNGIYSIVFDNSITFLPLALISAVSMDYFYSRTFVLTRELEGFLIVLCPFILITLMYAMFFTIHGSTSISERLLGDLSIVQGWLALCSIVYATGMKYIMFVS